MNYLQLPDSLVFNAFRELLCCGLWNRSPKDTLFHKLEQTHWQLIMRLSIDQAVNGIVFSAIDKLPEELRPDKSLYLQWFAQVQHIKLYNRHLRKTWAELCEVLRLNGLEPVLMKGLGASTWYPEPLLRRQGDLDVYIPHNYDKAIEVMMLKAQLAHYGDEHDVFSFHEVTVELHRNGVYGLNGKDVINIEDEYGSYTIPNNEHNAVLLLQHAAKHYFYVGLGLRHLCDWALFLAQNSESTNFDYVIAQARQKGFARFAKVFTHLAVSFLELPSQYVFLHEDSPKLSKEVDFLLRQIICVGDFSKGQWQTSKHIFSNKRSFFSSLADIATYYYRGLVRLWGGYRWYPQMARAKMFESFSNSLNFIKYKFSRK